MIFFADEKHKTRNKRLKGVNKGLSIYIGINYLLLTCFLDEDFCNSFRKKVSFRDMHNGII